MIDQTPLLLIACPARDQECQVLQIMHLTFLVTKTIKMAKEIVFLAKGEAQEMIVLEIVPKTHKLRSSLQTRQFKQHLQPL